MKYTNPQIVARNLKYGTMDFFLTANGSEHWLFRTSYFSALIFAAFSGGCPLRTVFRKTACVRMSRVRAHILRNVRALEAELGETILDHPKQGRKPQPERRRRSRAEHLQDWLEAA